MTLAFYDIPIFQTEYKLKYDSKKKNTVQTLLIMSLTLRLISKFNLHCHGTGPNLGPR